VSRSCLRRRRVTVRMGSKFQVSPTAVHRIRLDIAGIGFAFSSDDNAPFDSLRRRISPAVVSAQEHVDICTRVVTTDREVGPHEGLPGMEWSESGLRIWEGGMEGRFDPLSGEAELLITRGGPEFLLENYLRAVVAVVSLSRGGILLHSASVIRDGRAYLFFGPSGAGKSTSAELSTSYHVTGDDLSVLHLDESGVQLVSVPFRSSSRSVETYAGSAPVSRILRLQKDSTDFVEAIPTAIAVAMLMEQSPWVNTAPLLFDRLFDVCSRIVQRVPPQMLHFRKSSDFWQML
jgi:hypothetical protein